MFASADIHALYLSELGRNSSSALQTVLGAYRGDFRFFSRALHTGPIQLCFVWE